MRQVAFLRGVNVGRAKRVAMADLKRIAEGLGWREVRTVLNSGNLVFEAGRAAPATSARRLERALADQLGLASRVTVLGAAELAAALADNPLMKQADDPSHMMIGVAAGAADLARLQPLLAKDWTPEAIALGPRVVYAWCANGIARGALMAEIERAARGGITSRNVTTMARIVASASQREGEPADERGALRTSPAR